MKTYSYKVFDIKQNLWHKNGTSVGLVPKLWAKEAFVKNHFHCIFDCFINYKNRKDIQLYKDILNNCIIYEEILTLNSETHTYTTEVSQFKYDISDDLKLYRI